MARAEAGLNLAPGALLEVFGGRGASRASGAGGGATEARLVGACEPGSFVDECVGRKGVGLVSVGGGNRDGEKGCDAMGQAGRFARRGEPTHGRTCCCERSVVDMLVDMKQEGERGGKMDGKVRVGTQATVASLESERLAPGGESKLADDEGARSRSTRASLPRSRRPGRRRRERGCDLAFWPSDLVRVGFEGAGTR